MMKRVTVLSTIILFFTINVVAQKIPVIDSEICRNMSYTDQQLKDWSQYLAIYEKESTNEKLSGIEVEFKKSFEKKYDLSDFSETEMAPWDSEPAGCSWYCGATYETAVSSSLPAIGANSYSSNELFDGDARTAWVEGTKGYGVGEWITFTFDYNAARATTCFIVNGYNKNALTWQNNSRVKSFNLYDNDQLIATVNLKDTRDMQRFELLYAFPNRPEDYDRFDESTSGKQKKDVALKFVITEVYKGNKYDDTAISEMFFDGTDVHCLAANTEILMADESSETIDNIQVGDSVIAFVPSKNEYAKRKVTYVHTALHSRMYRLTLQDGTQIVTTDDHPFLSSKGWRSLSPEKTMKYEGYGLVRPYSIGTELYVYDADARTSSPIILIEGLMETVKTYSLELDGEGAYVANFMLVGQE